MADFVPSQKYASDFNKAKKYENGDAVQAETVNNLIEGQLFVQGIAANQPKVVEDNTEGEPIVYFENKDGLPRFVFRNIRGKDGKMGEKGDNGNIMRFTDSALHARSDVGTLLTIGSGNLINGQNVAVGDVVLDIHYQEGENYYICIWEVTTVNSEYSIYLRGMDYIPSTGGGGTVKIEVDNQLSTTSENPVQNKVVTTALNAKVPTTTTVNGHPLSSNVTVTKSDVGLSEVANESPATIRAGLKDTNVKNALGYTPTSPSDLAKLNENLSLRISTLDEDITDIKTGETVVNKAENDSNGNKIINTYATKSEANARAKTIEYSWESVGADGVNPFKLNLTLKDANGNQLSTTQIDFPLEQMVIDAEYDKVNKQLILKLPDTQFPVPVADIFEGLATKTELDETNKTVNNLSTEVSGYSRRITDAEANIGQLQDEKLDKSGGTMTGEIAIGQGDGNGIQLGKSGYINATNNDGSNTKCTLLGANALNALVGHSQFDLQLRGKGNAPTYNGNTVIHSGNIGSQHVAIADELECHYDTTIAIDNPDGHLRYSSNVPSAATGIFPCNNNANAILTISKHGGHFDSQLGFSSNGNMYYRSFNDEAMNNTKPWKTIVDSDNFETYIRNYMNRKILEQPY